MPVRRKNTKNKTCEYDTPECFVAGCREIETAEYRVVNADGKAVEWYCVKHARRLVWNEYWKHAVETGRRQ